MAAPHPPFDPAVVPVLLTGGHAAWLGLQMRDHGADWFELALPWRQELIGDPDNNVLASGPILSMMDTVCSLAAWQKFGLFLPIATLDLRIDYMRPAMTGRDIVGRAECYRVTRTIAFVRGIAHDGDADDPVAHVVCSFMKTGSITP